MCLLRYECARAYYKKIAAEMYVSKCAKMEFYGNGKSIMFDIKYTPSNDLLYFCSIGNSVIKITWFEINYR